ARKMMVLPGFISELRRSSRPRYRDVHDLQNRFTLFSLKPENLRSVLRTTKAWGITLNDLFLALLMKSLVPLAVARAKGPRNRLSVGCIVNTRKDLGFAGRRTLGVFLGSFIVTREIPEAVGLADLAKDVRDRTARIKRHKIYLAAPLEFTLGRW